MSKELVVSSSAHESRLAILENDRLVELYIERESQQGQAGSIHKGRVTRVLPGMQSAFVDIGLERDAFLYVTDFFDAAGEFESEAATAEAGAAPSEGDQAEAAGESEARPERREVRRGRRGRRGRRRGSRGGFPEAKYATLEQPRVAGSETSSAVKAAPAPRTPSEPPIDHAGPEETEFTVLPGESLAKYRDRPAEAVSPEQPAESEAAVERDRHRGEDLGADAEAAVADGHDGAGEAAALLVDRNRKIVESAADPHSNPPDEGPAGDRLPDDTEHPTPASAGVAAGAVSEGEIEPPAGGGAEREALTAVRGPAEREELGKQAAAEFATAPEAAEASSDALHPENPLEVAETPAEAGSEQAVRGGEEADQAPLAGAEMSARDEPKDNAHDSTPGEPLPPPAEEARVRTRAGSSRYLQRRGRRGRRSSRSAPRAEAAVGAAPSGQQEAATESPAGQPPDISTLLSKGQEILVQISKEPLGKKGARITSHIALPGRYLVYMPTVDHVGVSRKIASDAERQRLRSIIRKHRTGMTGGFIARTAGEGASEEEIHGDMLFLYNLWLDIRERAERRSTPGLIHQDLDVVERILRDQLDEDFKTIWVDAEDEYERILRFVERFQPRLLPCVKLYTRQRPVFDEFNITAETEKALRPKVWLKSGGYIVINQTEALVAIDVNTGKYVGKSDRLEDTIVNTNIEALKEVVRQLRLRDLGGIIVIDFIDMEDRKNRHRVGQALEEELRHDRAPSKVLPFNDFGLISITRKRVKQSLERALCTPCPYCQGSGSVKSIPTIILEILEEARKMAPEMDRQKDVTLRVNPEIARRLKSRDNSYLQEIEDILRRHVLVRSDMSLHRENFTID